MATINKNSAADQKPASAPPSASASRGDAAKKSHSTVRDPISGTPSDAAKQDQEDERLRREAETIMPGRDVMRRLAEIAPPITQWDE